MMTDNQIEELCREGEQLAKEGRHDEAARRFDRAVELRPDDLEILRRRLQVLLVAGKTAEALERLDGFIAANPRVAQPLLAKADLLSLIGQTKEAVACLDEALTFEQENAEIWRRRGLALRHMGEFEGAIESFERALRINPSDAPAWRGIGDVMLDGDEIDGALKCFGAAARLDPAVLSASDWSQRADRLYGKGKTELALSLYDRALQQDGRYTWAWRGRGLALKRLGRPDEAIECFAKAVEIDPGNAMTLVDWGNIHFERGDLAAAWKCYELAWKADPEEFFGWFNAGIVKQHLGLWEEAAELFDRAAEIDGEYAPVWMAKGVCAQQLKRYADAEKYYGEHLKLNPKSAAGLINMGLVLAEQHRYKEATAYFDGALALDKSDWVPWTNKADALRRLGMMTEAEACFREGAEQAADKERALTALAEFLAEYKGNDAEALDLFRQVSEMNPADLGAKASIAELLIKLGQFAEGRRYAVEAASRTTDEKLRCITNFLVITADNLENATGAGADEYNTFFARMASLSKEDRCMEGVWNYSGLIRTISGASIPEERRFLLLTMIDLQLGRVQRSNLTYFAGDEARAGTRA
jgi:tetratricopeptide (TPR) repeat protein